MKKSLTPKKIILTLITLFGIYLLGIPLYYTPYELQPSYWKFKNMCELNYIPNSEEKYNRILAYFNKSLDGSIDDFSHTNKSHRIELLVLIYYKNGFEKRLSFDNIDNMGILVDWDTWRLYLSGNEGNMDFRIKKDIIPCGNINKEVQIKMCSKYIDAQVCRDTHTMTIDELENKYGSSCFDSYGQSIKCKEVK